MTTTAAAACCCSSAAAAGCCSTCPARTSSATVRSSGSWACAGRVTNRIREQTSRGSGPGTHRAPGPVLGSGSRVRGVKPVRGVTNPGRELRSKTGRQPALPKTQGASPARGGRGTSHKEVSPVQGVHTADAVIDNGPFGTHTIRFETGRLARLANGSAVVYLDDETMVLSATTASKQPREGLDFLPLTVDVEERMYAAGRIPGSFFRREGRPSEDAILTVRLIDRPLRPSFVKGLRNEVQVVETIMALHPEHLYDVVAINAASLSTQLAGLPFSGPIGATRMAHVDGQWIAFPTLEELSRATFDMVVAGRVLEDGDVAIMMVEAEATPATVTLVREGVAAPTEEVVAAGLEASKAAIKEICRAQLELAKIAAKPTREYPLYAEYGD